MTVDKSAYKRKGDKQNLKPPKSQTSKRRVYFSELLKDAFVRWREKQSEDKKAAGTGWNEQGFIFTNAVGGNLVDCLRIGNRSYLCVEMFDEPYVKRFCRAAVTLREPETNFQRGGADQRAAVRQRYNADRDCKG